MGRPLRVAVGGFPYHVLNRSNGGVRIFDGAGDYAAFENILWEGCARVGMRVLAYCLMSNHWHVVAYPRKDGDLSVFVGWVTLTHAQRWHAARRDAGTGHLYQGRYKSFVVEGDAHLIAVCRYVERNPLRARLVRKAEDWRWGSLWRFASGEIPVAMAGRWPAPRPRDWITFVNGGQTGQELAEIRESVVRGRPFGDAMWTARMVRRFRLNSTLRDRGRPAAAIPREKGS